MRLDGKAWVRLAQLRGRIAVLARGGQYDDAVHRLGELIRFDLAVGLPADGLLRARQAAALAEEQGSPTAGPLVGLASALLATGDLASALEAAALAIERARPGERTRIEVLARLVGGAAQRRLGRNADARVLLDAARGGAARIGESAIAGFALVELGWVDLAEQRALAAGVCLEFGAEFLRRAKQHGSALEADALAVVCWVEAGDVPTATDRSPKVADAARAAGRPDIIAFLDGAMADLALGTGRRSEAARHACALAAESALALPDTAVARDLVAQARLRQVRASDDPLDRERHLEAGIEVALTLDRPRAGARLGSALVGLLGDAQAHPPTRDELRRLGSALESLGDPELAEMARGVLAEL